MGDDDGQTPLGDDELVGLRLSYITTRGELNAAEQDNIAKAMNMPVPSMRRLCDDRYLRELHVSMFGEVWMWAGKYRTTMRNIGVDAIHVGTAVRDLCADAAVWAQHGGNLDRAAARFSHRLVAIHPFPNGNGRHSRRAADLYLASVGQRPFSWGAASGASSEELRRVYLAALRRADADHEDLDALVAFARS